MLANSTLKLEVTKQNVNCTTPWAVGGAAQSSATVTAIQYKGNTYLITNAHAVLNATYLKVKFNQGSAELPVEPVWVDPHMDLAILVDKNNEIKTTIQPLNINVEFYPSGTEVNAYGYPSGGKTLSLTKGHISRTEISTIAFSRLPGLIVQTSAPINPGNSGGPITKSNKEGVEECIGIVCQGNTSLSNVGYFIHASVLVHCIENYLKFAKLKKAKFIDFVTVPHVNFEWQCMKNDTLRTLLGMNPKTINSDPIGIYITNIPENSCARNILKEGDILIEMDSYPVQSDGNVKVKELENPISYLYLIQRKKFMDEFPVTVLRINAQKQPEKLELKIRLKEQLGVRNLLGSKIDKPLTYHIQPSGKSGAFVFIECTEHYMDTFKRTYSVGGGTVTDNSCAPNMFNRFRELYRKDDLSKIVVLHNILNSEETDGYENMALSRGALCESDRVIKVNDQPVSNLFDLVQLLEKNSEKTSLIKFTNGKVLAIPPEVKNAPDSKDSNTRDALKSRYQIAFFTSEKLSPVKPGLYLDELTKSKQFISNMKRYNDDINSNSEYEEGPVSKRLKII